MCDVSFDETWTGFSEKTVKARKDHVCRCCGGPIRAGTKYRRHFSVMRGEKPCSERMCIPCSRVTKSFADEHGTWTNPSAMPELLHECVNSGDERSAVWKRAHVAMNRRRSAREAT